MKAVCALLLILAFVFRVDAQASSSITPSNNPSPSGSNSWTVSNTASLPASPSHSNTNSWTNSVSGSLSGSVTKSRSISNSHSNSWTSSNSATRTYPQPPAPTNIVNGCAVPTHIVNICPSWTPPAGFVFSHFNLFLRVTGSTDPPQVFQVSGTSVRITDLQPSTSYDFAVEGVLPNGVRSLLSATATFATVAADPKKDKTRDISNIACVNVKSTTTNRSIITCTWTAALDPVHELRVKASCDSDIREPNEVRKNLFGARATATSITLNMNRDVATCVVYIRARYLRRRASRHQLTVLMGQ